MLFNPFVIPGIGLVNKSVAEIVFSTCGSHKLSDARARVYLKFFDYTMELANICVSILIFFLI